MDEGNQKNNISPVEKEDPDFERFKRALNSNDPVMMVLRAHLLAEHYIDLIVMTGLRRGDIIIDRNYTFSQKLTIIESLDCLDKELIDSLKALNAVRNQCSHILDYQVIEQDIDKIGRPFSRKYLDYKKKYGTDYLNLLIAVLGYLAGRLTGASRRYLEQIQNRGND